jgi:hypothetical protein
MAESDSNVVTYRRRIYRRRTRRYQRRKRTPAELAASRENFYKSLIAGRGLQDSPEARLLYKQCPEAFFPSTFKDGRFVPNEITSTQLKLMIAGLKVQQIMLTAAQPINSVPAPRARKKPGRPASTPLSVIWEEKKDEFEPMLLTGQAELSKKLHAELRGRGYKIATAKKVRDFIRYKVKSLKNHKP